MQKEEKSNSTTFYQSKRKILKLILLKTNYCSSETYYCTKKRNWQKMSIPVRATLARTFTGYILNWLCFMDLLS